MNGLNVNVANREKIISSLKEEIIGPTINFENAQDINVDDLKRNNFFYYFDQEKKEEIFSDGLPSKKYASGLLYPTDKRDNVDLTSEIEEEALSVLSEEREEDKNDINENTFSSERISTVDQYRQSTMGMTFAVPNDLSEVGITFHCGIYEEKDNLLNPSSVKKWWFRKSLTTNRTINLNREERIQKELLNLVNENNKSIDITVHSVIREFTTKETKENLKIVTITIENSSFNTESDDCILFQCELEAEVKDAYFLPYPSASDMNVFTTKEDTKFEMLYSEEKTYAFGHDCAVQWNYHDSQVNKIHTTFLPEFEIKTMTPDIIVDNKKVVIHHAHLAGASTYEEIKTILEPLVEGYAKWFENLKKEEVKNYYKDAKTENLNQIERTINKIKRGLNFLKDEKIFEVFKLTNLAMLMQMNMGKDIRSVSDSNNDIKFSKEAENPFLTLDYRSSKQLFNSIKKEFNNNDENHYMKSSRWRGFQIAFLLQSIESIVNPVSEDREEVDVIWFPTGGGKTEAYLAVSAFSMLYRRFMNPEDSGVDIIMRYTLRMLTADQFQRTSRLITSLEFLRSKFPNLLGETEYSIGLWVGSKTTPNSNKQAKRQYNNIISKSNAEEFIVNSCPFCGAEMKKVNVFYLGYKYNNRLSIHCPDKLCHFHKHLPIYIVDEDIYNFRPTYVIGTVDKFVQLTWKPEARSIFGINEKGDRDSQPPTIIIQDELHLISGSLGTLTGMYEVLIDYLSTNMNNGQMIKPKIIAATATTKAYESQIKGLFGRENSQIFPPSGLSINDNFFSTIMYDEKMAPMPGRKYVGVYTTTQGLLQTQVQTFSSLLISGNALPEEEKDPFWTILSFYNRINDIGKAITLTQQDIPNNMKYYYDKRKIENQRDYSNLDVKELTSRMNSTSLSREITELKIPYSTSKKTNDITLASNIIEVGIDIDRLSLMTIVGQPKTTSQYIQVSGRVGRKTTERPGLVVVLYDNNNSNDKSHFEHFIEYHQKLYAQVEESSITPFSNFAIDRGFPAVMIGFIRQFFDLKTLGRKPEGALIEQHQAEIKDFMDFILKKVHLVDSSSDKYIKSVANNLLNKLVQNNYDQWEHTPGKNGVIVRMSKDKDSSEEIIPIINSMRSVDAESKLLVKNISKSGGFFGYD